MNFLKIIRTCKSSFSKIHEISDLDDVLHLNPVEFPSKTRNVFYQFLSEKKRVHKWAQFSSSMFVLFCFGSDLNFESLRFLLSLISYHWKRVWSLFLKIWEIKKIQNHCKFSVNKHYLFVLFLANFIMFRNDFFFENPKKKFFSQFSYQSLSQKKLNFPILPIFVVIYQKKKILSGFLHSPTILLIFQSSPHSGCPTKINWPASDHLTRPPLSLNLLSR